MRFLLPTMVAATMLIAVGATGSKAEAAMMPGVATLPAQTKTYMPVENVYYRRYYRRGYYRLSPPVLWLWISAVLRLRLRLSALWLLWLWLETRHQHWHRAWLGLALLKAASLLRLAAVSASPFSQRLPTTMAYRDVAPEDAIVGRQRAAELVQTNEQGSGQRSAFARVRNEVGFNNIGTPLSPWRIGPRVTPCLQRGDVVVDLLFGEAQPTRVPLQLSRCAAEFHLT